METRSGRIVSLPASQPAQITDTVGSIAVRVMLVKSVPPPIPSSQVTATGALAILDSQEVTSDTELLAVSDTLLSI